MVRVAGFADLNLQLAPQLLLIKNVHVTCAGQHRCAHVIHRFRTGQCHEWQHRNDLVELRIGLSRRDLRVAEQRQANRLAFKGRDLQMKVRALDVIPDLQGAAEQLSFQHFRFGWIDTGSIRAKQQNLLLVRMLLAHDLDDQFVHFAGRAIAQPAGGHCKNSLFWRR
ncbi:hypothetical protein [Pseudomonas syringae group genomosp. 3]|uniref:hypothetical protein n=1 Tax=Pseudomonas syringae group genomosp. 3 TaxID=251701 RepID=UPI001F16CB72|nr:hypothetical protein [Pseudomonas syringae group genomosp. 3]